MIFKRLSSLIISLVILLSVFACTGITAFAEEKNIEDYTYKIIPLLAPFNEYFFVETDNPDPLSFRFVDKDSKYSEDSVIEFDYDSFYEKVNLYSDIKYDDEKTGRVDGGYIFESYNTDGGELVLQSAKKSYYSWNTTWTDTDTRISLPVLKDDVDYLIDTYADKSDFFDNMDAVQKGLSSICLYSGSYIRGDIEKTDEYWFVATAGHSDQSFYMYSPYSRNNNKYLIASRIYPFRKDSLGFPYLMGSVAMRLDKNADYEWSSTSHYLINVTYNGKTKSYGGAGIGDGQGLTEDKITQYFSFGDNGTEITLNGIKKLLDYYSKIKMTDDIPREDALSWKDICDKVGSEGAWVRISGSNAKSGNKWILSNPVYTFMYKENEGKNFIDSEWGTGYRLYYSGDLESFSDTWVDGRYINSSRCFVQGAKFEDHPKSNLYLSRVKIPQIKYTVDYVWNNDLDKYEKEYTVDEIAEKEMDVLFEYSADDDIWIARYNVIESKCASYYEIKELVDDNKLDEKYLDMVTLTSDEVSQLNVDYKTDIYPESGYIYDGNDAPGTEFKLITLNNNNSSISLSQTEFTYSGNTVTPEVTVKYENSTLTENVDYELKFINNIKTGTAKVVVKGIGDYAGSLSKEFIINKANISNAVVSGITDKDYTGKAIEQKPFVSIDDKVLEEGVDYEIIYSNNTNVGTAEITIKGIGDYDGEITKSFNIKEYSTDISESTQPVTDKHIDPTETTTPNSNPDASQETTVPINEPSETMETIANPESQEQTVTTEKFSKKPNPAKITVKAKTVKSKKLRKRAQKIKAITVKNAKGKVTYKLIKKGSAAKIFKRASINKKGVIVIKKWKRAKKGIYKLKVRITVRGNKKFKSKTVNRIVKVRLK